MRLGCGNYAVPHKFTSNLCFSLQYCILLASIRPPQHYSPIEEVLSYDKMPSVRSQTPHTVDQSAVDDVLASKVMSRGVGLLILKRSPCVNLRVARAEFSIEPFAVSFQAFLPRDERHWLPSWLQVG